MGISFEGIGQMAVTFKNGAETGELQGQVVKISGSGAVSPCAKGERFMGLALHADEESAAVQIRGFIRLAYSGAAPSLGYTKLSADGSGGIQADTAGTEYLVVETDETGKTVSLFL